MDIMVILGIAWLHFFADFILQSDKMAKGKSTSNKWLGWHILVYSSVFIIISPLYALVNGILHFMTDYVSSRVSSRLYKKNEIHWFFAVIGLDQVLHLTALILTYEYMFL